MFEGADEVCRAAGVPSRCAFRALPAQQQEEARRLALQSMRDQQAAAGSADLVVAGHHTLCTGVDAAGRPTLECVWTEADAEFYTAIVFLTADPAAVSARLAARDGARRRHLPAAAVAAWQEAELRAVRESCAAAGIRLVVADCPERGIAEGGPLPRAVSLLGPLLLLRRRLRRWRRDGGSGCRGRGGHRLRAG